MAYVSPGIGGLIYRSARVFVYDWPSAFSAVNTARAFTMICGMHHRWPRRGKRSHKGAGWYPVIGLCSTNTFLTMDRLPRAGGKAVNGLGAGITLAAGGLSQLGWQGGQFCSTLPGSIRLTRP